MPWEAWGETDCLLDRAVNEHDRRLCGCGCGHWESETHGDEGEGEWLAVEEICWAREAIDTFLKEQKERPPGQLLYVRRKVLGED